MESSTEFVADTIETCTKDRLDHFAVHSRPEGNRDGFSSTNLISHELEYPSLLDINSAISGPATTNVTPSLLYGP